MHLSLSEGIRRFIMGISHGLQCNHHVMVLAITIYRIQKKLNFLGKNVDEVFLGPLITLQDFNELSSIWNTIKLYIKKQGHKLVSLRSKVEPGISLSLS